MKPIHTAFRFKTSGKILPTQLVLLTVLGVSAALAGCAGNTSRSDTANYSPSSTAQASYGRIESIETVAGGTGGSSGAGAVVGGLVGGLLGNQVGGGTGRTAATVAGAVGGAVAGNQIEKNRPGSTSYRIGIRLDDGGYLTVHQDSVGDLRVGDHISVQNNRVYRY